MKTIADPLGNVAEVTYDLNRRKVLTMAHDGPVTAALLAETRTTYDAVGRVTLEEAAKCFTTASPCLASGTTVATWIPIKATAYTRTGKPSKVTDADGAVTRTLYDALDRTLTAIDPALRQVHFVYCLLADANCAANAVRIEQRAYGSSNQQNYATYTYTLNGKQATVLDADGGGHLTSFAYDSFDRLITTTFPDSTHEDLVYYTGSALCSAAGTPCSRTTRAGQTMTYTYDRLDRMLTKAVPITGGTRTTTWTYDLAGRIETLVDDGDNSIDPAYDTAGRMITNARAAPGLSGTQTVSYQYDIAGNRTRITWPGTDGYYVQYGYDHLNRMAAACENGAFSNTSLTCTSGFTLAAYAYDSLSRPTTLAYAPSTGGATMAYSYSNAGDLATLNQDLTGTADDPHYTFTYTLAHQLASMSHTDTNYRWQATPNCGANPDAVAYTHNGLNQYTAIASCNGAISASPAYDPNGNLTGDGAGWTYTYDAENRMTTASATGTSASYLYDPLDHRSSKLVNSVYTFFLGDTQDDEIAEYSRVSDTDQTPVLLRRFVPGPGTDQPIAMVTAAAVRTYFHQNRQGSVIAMSRDDGTKSEGPFTYDPYGFVAGPTCTSSCALASGGEPYKFTGRRLDPETGLYYYRARYYSWQLGRFMQVDPIGYQADLNLYTYAGNDPIDKTDPSGLTPEGPPEGNTCSRLGGNSCSGSYAGDGMGSGGGRPIERGPAFWSGARPQFAGGGSGSGRGGGAREEDNMFEELFDPLAPLREARFNSAQGWLRQWVPRDRWTVTAGSRSAAPALQAVREIEARVEQVQSTIRGSAAIIRAGGPFSSSRDGITFENREGRLPTRPLGYYREYRVRDPARSARSRGDGPWRIVTGRGGEMWFSGDHYQTFNDVQ